MHQARLGRAPFSAALPQHVDQVGECFAAVNHQRLADGAREAYLLLECGPLLAHGLTAVRVIFETVIVEAAFTDRYHLSVSGQVAVKLEVERLASRAKAPGAKGGGARGI